MYKDNRFVAIIPARSGSKGLKDKNIKLLNGKPMVAYTIEEAVKSKIFDDIIVSTDSKIYAEIAERYGAKVPFLRPEELATDTAATRDVIVDTIQRLKSLGKEYDYLMILQPTSPLRRAEDIVKAVDLLYKKDALSVVSICEAEHSPLYMNVLEESLSLHNFISNNMPTRRQELRQYYRLNGAIYLCAVDYYVQNGDLYSEESYAYVMQKENSIDIDDEVDFILSEILLKQKSR